LKTTDWRVAPLAAMMWRWNKGDKGWMKGTRDETHDGGDNYVQMTDDEQIRFAVGLPDGESVWVECRRHANGATLRVWEGPDGQTLFTKELGKKDATHF
jgi:hypothetical protein